MALRPRSALVPGLSVLALLALMAGCGGSSSRSTAPLAGAGTSATGFTQGVISGFGTIHIGRGTNERVFHTEGAVLTLYDDGVTRNGGNDAAMFRVGMKVKVYCDKDDSSRANEVIFMNDLEGPITAKPSANAGATFDVLGVPVLADANTHLGDSFEDRHLTLDSLMVGNVIEVSGDFDANNVLHATYIKFKADSAAGRTFEIKGPILNLAGAPPTQTFMVHGASFTTDMNTRIDNLSGGLADSAFVEVKTRSTTPPMLATQVKGLADHDHEHGDDDDHDHDGDMHHEGQRVLKAEVEGFVDGLTGTSPNFSFMIDMKHVITNSATRGLSSVMANARVEVRGAVDSTGTITATKIEHDDD